MEQGSTIEYNKWAVECSQNADSASKSLFESLPFDEERHYNQYDDEIGNIAKYGYNYFVLQSIERNKTKNILARSPAAV